MIKSIIMNKKINLIILASCFAGNLALSCGLGPLSSIKEETGLAPGHIGFSVEEESALQEINNIFNINKTKEECDPIQRHSSNIVEPQQHGCGMDIFQTESVVIQAMKDSNNPLWFKFYTLDNQIIEGILSHKYIYRLLNNPHQTNQTYPGLLCKEFCDGYVRWCEMNSNKLGELLKTNKYFKKSIFLIYRVLLNKQQLEAMDRIIRTLSIFDKDILELYTYRKLPKSKIKQKYENQIRKLYKDYINQSNQS